MNKTLKKVLIVLAVVAAVFAVGGVIVNRVAESKLRSALSGIPGVKIDFGRLHLSLLAGNLELKDVEIALRDSTGKSLELEGRMEALGLERLRWRSLLKGEAHARRLLIRGPEARLVLPQKAAKKASEPQAPDTASFLKKISLSELRVEKGKIGLDSRANKMKVSAQGIAVSVKDIGFELADNRLAFNDSCYFVAVDSLDFMDAEGLNRIQVGHLATADAGPVEALAMHLYNCVPMEQVAERMGKVSAMWYDVKLDTLNTSAVNIPRIVNGQGGVDLERVYLSGPSIVLFQDDRYPPAVPYPTFQESLNTIQIPLQIKDIEARVKAFTFIWETTHVNRGTFPLHNLRLAVKSASNAPNNLMEMDIRSHHGSSRLNFALFVRNDKAETTHGKMQIHELDASSLDPFIRPLFGATAKAEIHQIDCSFKGDKHRMTEDFCMLYSDLSLKAWNDASAPFKIVAQNSGTISFLANLAVPKNNPVKEGKDPKKVEVTFDRDPMLPYPSYLIQNLTQGMLKTVLPGGAVKKSKAESKAGTGHKENLQKK